MFDVWCPTCQARTLLSPRRLLRLARTATGHRAQLRCWCGTVVALDVTGPRAAPAAATTGGPGSGAPEVAA